LKRKKNSEEISGLFAEVLAFWVLGADHAILLIVTDKIPEKPGIASQRDALLITGQKIRQDEIKIANNV
jgi:hypothetical protein